MKKFISMVMAAAMVVSLVPATAFAKGEVTATAKIVDAWEKNKDFNGLISGADVPEVQLKVTGVDYQKTDDGTYPEMDVTYTLDNANFYKNTTGTKYTANELKGFFEVREDGTTDVLGTWGATAATYNYVAETDKDVVAAALLDGTAEYYSDAAGATELEIGTAPLAGIHTVGAVETPGTTEAEALAAFVGPAGAGKTRAGEIAGNKVYVATAAFTADGTNTDTYAIGDVVVFAEDLATVEDDLYTRAEVLAEIVAALPATSYKKVVATAAGTGITGAATDRVAIKALSIEDDNEIKVTFAGKFEKDDIISFDLKSLMDKTSEGRKATVSVESDMVSVDDLVYASILGYGITASVKKVANVAEEEKVVLEKDLKIKSNVGDFVNGQEFTLKTSKGFEFAKVNNGVNYTLTKVDDNEYTLTWNGAATDEIVVDADDIEIEATTAKSGAVCTLTVKAVKGGAGTFSATATVEVVKVVDYKVVLSVDEDEDVPVIYSGVNVDNYGITDDSDHISLEVTAEETFPGAWSMRKGFNFELPEGVYVTDVDVTDAEYFYVDDAPVGPTEVEDAFWNAYREGDHLNFEFEKRVFDDVDNGLNDKKCATMTFTLTLVADPGFEGDVVLKLTGDLVDEQEVTIAKFVAPYTVKAEQNDLIIDYRYTEVPTAIVITEAEAGLWAKDDAQFSFVVERGDMIQFEDDATFEVDADSDLDIDDFTDERDGIIGFDVDGESDEAATVTIKDMSLFMQRNIPAGPYDLSINSSLAAAYEGEILFAADAVNSNVYRDKDAYGITVWRAANGYDRPATTTAVKEDSYVGDVCDYSDVVKEAWVNVVTAGRDVDDASFTTKVVVPVGETKMYAGEREIALDVPAYISAAGYTMLPVRAVATALGIDNNCVLWDAATKTVTILYGQRIITMVAGQKVVYVNGSAIPASAAVEIVNGRTFLPMRDLATALGVTDITWDAATKTATLNGNK